MQVDWITVAAQIANFLVLIWILRRLLYGPVTRAMERREANIRARFAEAERREAEAAASSQELRGAKADLEARSEQILEAARDEADALRCGLEREARAEIDRRRSGWRAQLREGEEAFLHDLRYDAASHAGRVARRALSDFASVELEAAVADAFIEKLKALNLEAREALSAAAAPLDGVVVETAFDPPEAVRKRLSAKIREIVGADKPINFERNAELVCGIRLRVAGQTVNWSWDSYLDDLEASVKSALDAASRREVAAQSEVES